MSIKIKRAYVDTSNNDGIRILVDRIWPRGVSKEKLNIDQWMKEIAPSKELRKWFNHEPEKFYEFKQKYKGELQHNQQWGELKKLALEKKTITLVYGAKDEKHNQAVVLKELLENLF